MAELRDGRTYWGLVWTDGKYDGPFRPSILNVGVGEGGVSILAILSRLRLYNGNVEAVVNDYGPYVTADDVRAAISYYERAADRSEIDERLEAEEHVSPA